MADLSQYSDAELAAIAGQAPPVTPERIASANKLFGSKGKETLAQIDKYPATAPAAPSQDLSQYSDAELEGLAANAGGAAPSKGILQDLLGGSKAAIGAGVNEQTFGLANPFQQEQKENPNMASVGRVGSYVPGMFLGTGEEGILKRLAAGPASALMHGTEKAVGKVVPTAIGKAALKVPAVLGVSAGAQEAGRDIKEYGGIDSSKIAAEASKAATDPGYLALGYGGQLLGAAGRAANLPERTYALSGATEGQMPSEAIPNARFLMDQGIRAGSTEGLYNKAKAALTPVAEERAAIINKAQKVAPNYAYSAQDLTAPLREEALNASRSATYPERAVPFHDLMSQVYSKYGSEPINMSRLEEIGQQEKSAIRKAIPGGKLSEMFQGAVDPQLSAKNEAARALVSRIASLQRQGISEILPENLGMTDEAGRPQNVERYKQLADQYGALKDASQNFAERAGKEMTPYMRSYSAMYPVKSAIGKGLLPPLATNTASILDQILNKEKGVSAPQATAILRSLLEKGQ